MKYYLKGAIFGFAYLVVMDFVSLLVSYIENKAVQAILTFVAVAFYCFIIGVIFFKDGETALDYLHSNDLQRRRMVETGEIVELKTAPEYKPYKGFIIGALICAPLVFLLILHLIIGLATGGTANGAGIAASFAYFSFYMLYGTFQTATLTFGDYFILLYSVVITSAAVGIPYIFGAKKSQKKYDLIERKHREIYGENN